MFHLTSKIFVTTELTVLLKLLSPSSYYLQKNLDPSFENSNVGVTKLNLFYYEGASNVTTTVNLNPIGFNSIWGRTIDSAFYS